MKNFKNPCNKITHLCVIFTKGVKSNVLFPAIPILMALPEPNNDLLEQSVAKVAAGTSSKTASTSDKISKSKSKSIALSHAGVKATDLIDDEIEYDADDGVAQYEISFEADGYDYEYDIRASDGKILKKEKERDD